MNEEPQERRLLRRLERADAYLARNDLVAASAAYQAIAAAHPDFAPLALRMLSLAERQGRFRDAHALAVRLSSKSSSQPEAMLQLAQALVRHGETNLATGLLREVAKEPLRDTELLQEVAQLAILVNETDLARDALSKLALAQPQSPGIHYQLGVLDVFSGAMDAAESRFETCLRLAPGFGQAHWSLSRLRRYSAASNHIDRLRKALAAAGPRDAPSIAFGLFKELDDVGDYDQAWSALSTGCSLKRASLDYRWSEDLAGFQALGRLQDSGYFSMPARLPPATGPKPIFIVGLPRSGSTLLEQMLASHPDIRAAGELPDFEMQMRWAGDRYSKSYLDAALIESVARDPSAEPGLRYLERTQWRAGGRTHYIDKMPMNFANTGFILRMVPGATVIHIRKSPMDACFSNLKELFTRMYQHSYRLDEMADYYRQYDRLMARWAPPVGLAAGIVEVDYAQLVTDPEATMRRVLAASGLPWNPACANPVDQSAVVTTASAAQFREPIHSRALDQWKNYAQWLGPMIDKLA